MNSTVQRKEWHPGSEHAAASELHLLHGHPDGLQTYWYEGGRKRLEVTYKDGKKEGAWAEWYENGKHRAKGSYADDKPDGKLSFWYDDGKPWAIKHYAKGVEDGKWSEWDRDGNLLPPDVQGPVPTAID